MEGPFCLPDRGAGGESRTPVASLENWSNDRYTTPALPLDYTVHRKESKGVEAK